MQIKWNNKANARMHLNTIINREKHKFSCKSATAAHLRCTLMHNTWEMLCKFSFIKSQSKIEQQTQKQQQGMYDISTNREEQNGGTW